MSTTPDTLYLIDSHALLYQVFHAIPAMSSAAGLPTNAVFGFTRDLLFLRQKNPTYLMAIFDAPGPTFRDEISKEYKAHRAPMPDDLRLQIPIIHELLHAMRLPVLSQQGVEADDLIATLSRRASDRGIHVFICSSDKDCRQLLDDRVKIFSLRKREVFDRDALIKDWGVTPEQVIDYQTMVGDSVDNVRGIEGVGPKTAAQYLQKYQSLDNLLSHLDELPAKKRENIAKARSYLEASRALVTLKRDVPIEEAWDEWRLRDWDGEKLLELFRDWGFTRLQDEVRKTLPATSIREEPTPPSANLETPPKAPATSLPTPRVMSQPGDLFASLDDGEVQTDATVNVAWKHDYQAVTTPGEFAAFMERFSKVRRFAIDLETTSLIPRSARIVGIAISWQASEAWYLALRGPSSESILDEAAVLPAFKPILEDPNIEKINQNIKYDMQVLRNHDIVVAGIAGDSMVADYLLQAGERSHGLDLLSEKYLNHRPIPIVDLIGKGKHAVTMDQVPIAQASKYACEDADIAWRLCEVLEPKLEEQSLKRFRSTLSKRADGDPGRFLYDDLEIPLIEVLADMEYTGIRLDVPFLKRMSKEMAECLGRVEEKVYRLAGRPFNIGSVKQLRGILFDELGFKPSRRTTITRAASTDQETLEDLARQGHELPRALLEHRKVAKLKSTYVDALPALVHPKTGRIHASFNQTVAATGRLSSSEPNLQNIPIRSEQGGQIRQAFLPNEGWSLIAADYSQIELRLLAHFSGDEVLKQAFDEDRDIHSLVASQVFGVKLAEVTGDQRRMAKTVNFGVIYGMSAFGLADRLEISKDDASAFIEAYFKTYPRVLDYQDQLLDLCRRQGYVSTILGRRRAISGIRATSSYKGRNQPEREAINMQIQGSAADLIKVAMLSLFRRLQRERRRAKLLLQIHDELVFEAPAEEVVEVSQIIRDEMTGALRDALRVVLGVELGVGPTWLDVK